MSKKKKNLLAKVQGIMDVKEHEVDHTTTIGFLQYLMMSLKRVDMSGSGAQLAYFFLLSFFPLLIFLVTLLPYLKLEQEQVFEVMADIMPGEIFTMVEDVLSQVLTNQNGGLLSVGIIGTLWTASRGVDALMKALNKAYDVEGRAGFINRSWSLLFTISFVVIILTALVLPIFGEQILNSLNYIGLDINDEITSLWTFISWIMPPLLILLLMTAVYWIVPNTNPRIKLLSIWPGALIATVGFLALTYGFSF
ncbi:MAG: YihY/virulence factor BrkB family protein, partial [Lysinibacillus sp.]